MKKIDGLLHYSATCYANTSPFIAPANLRVPCAFPARQLRVLWHLKWKIWFGLVLEAPFLLFPAVLCYHRSLLILFVSNHRCAWAPTRRARGRGSLVAWTSSLMKNYRIKAACTDKQVLYELLSSPRVSVPSPPGKSPPVTRMGFVWLVGLPARCYQLQLEVESEWNKNLTCVCKLGFLLWLVPSSCPQWFVAVSFFGSYCLTRLVLPGFLTSAESSDEM